MCFDSRHEQVKCVLSKSLYQLRSSGSIVYNGYRPFFHWIKRPGRETKHSPPLHADFNACRYTSSFPRVIMYVHGQLELLFLVNNQLDAQLFFLICLFQFLICLFQFKVVGTGWSWLRIGTGGGHLWVRWGTFLFHKCGEFLD